jgi:hypothetical protein
MDVARQVDAKNVCADNTGCWVGSGAHYVRVPSHAELLEKFATTAANDRLPPEPAANGPAKRGRPQHT